MKSAASASIVYLITKGDADAGNFAVRQAEILDQIRRAEAFGVTHFQIREKKLSAGLLFQLTAEAVKTAENLAVKILVNDRADIALAANADGVHLTSQSISAGEIRKIVPEKFIIGVSTHTLAELERAGLEGANFAVFSPVFASPDKGEPQGLEMLREVCEKMKPFPVVALGGVDAANYRKVLEAGAVGFAAIRYLNEKIAGVKVDV